ncbi:NAD(P)H-dependent oxidoreductase [Mycolicibacter sp. MYC123]|uniref:FMN dependent NADH:quinone oxidoreductase n=1 Tax=[Mycobacterium] zoologicum TaxID=2872311 RepID=A0ABU5YF83_9MYCO|nr:MULTISPECIES: NAD(P)H-dependent oxidoreductase [unclassified Mycolicibacter]MEB3048688.1 NAD(P)H-dependent oxidoreductase [Mycolicibacter sp. MYC123]MEB3063118.1 NAD(P)H-dependent oxidoreductase [Mycolicibacter sp. MYC101]
MRTLWVEASPKQEHSLSSTLAQAFLDAAPAAAVGEVQRFSVWTDEMLVFGRDAALAKFAPLYGERRSPEQKQIWAQVLAEIDRVRSFDRLVVSSPMWNWHVPHALKAWIDVIVQPMASFTLNERGEHVGTLGEGKPVQLILTRSSAYDGNRADLQDFQRPYLEYVFTMLGYSVQTLVFEPTTRWTPEERAHMREAALDKARRAGASL